MAEASNFKFGVQLVFAAAADDDVKAHHKATPRGRSGRNCKPILQTSNNERQF